MKHLIHSQDRIQSEFFSQKFYGKFPYYQFKSDYYSHVSWVVCGKGSLFKSLCSEDYAILQLRQLFSKLFSEIYMYIQFTSVRNRPVNPSLQYTFIIEM